MTSANVTAFLTALSGFAWPIAGLIIALLFRRFIAQVLSKENFSIKIAGMEVSVADATKQTGSTLTDLVGRVAQLEERIAGTTAQPTESEGPVTDVAEAASILWVDDYPSNNAFLIQKFEQDGIHVRKEISTAAALAALSQDSFTVIISDLGRTENGTENPLAGLDLVKAVRAIGIQTPILIFAGPRGVGIRDRLMSAGATEVTVSPVDVFHFVSEYRS